MYNLCKVTVCNLYQFHIFLNQIPSQTIFATHVSQQQKQNKSVTDFIYIKIFPLKNVRPNVHFEHMSCLNKKNLQLFSHFYRVRMLLLLPFVLSDML